MTPRNVSELTMLEKVYKEVAKAAPAYPPETQTEKGRRLRRATEIPRASTARSPEARRCCVDGARSTTCPSRSGHVARQHRAQPGTRIHHQPSAVKARRNPIKVRMELKLGVTSSRSSLAGGWLYRRPCPSGIAVARSCRRRRNSQAQSGAPSGAVMSGTADIDRIRAEQIRTIYRNTPPGLLMTLVAISVMTGRVCLHRAVVA